MLAQLSRSGTVPLDSEEGTIESDEEDGAMWGGGKRVSFKKGVDVTPHGYSSLIKREFFNR